ncbi:MAG: hypothetical protein KDH20_01290 [Rhodocyclaceae bacterium]|nr:hypothetical protein [Rhodocyclaceae bacterium]
MSVSSPATDRRNAPPVPWHARLLLALGGVCGLAGSAVAADLVSAWHPLLAADGTAIVLLVSAVALVGSGLFPIVFQRLAAADNPAPPTQ